ncbi:hypothetical protein DFO66_101437 [Brevibacterium sanguinis]|uniref:Uncharacterized protein n=2 Tax=Brevibacterium TaxID=1696 RepID=A0A366IMR7_9MICO|nr:MULTISPECIES: hypothetical protein [Brevibacterium]RBP68209.1 hypothetical protein DFO66_101437 [Brevibacterium sanguinis]RBP74374.1 hypothetical protein DFO65_10192 [Brevibacterium celere]
MDLLVLLIICGFFTSIVFVIGRFACPRYDRVPLMEVDHVIAWTTLRRGWHALGAIGPLTNVIDEPPDRNPA